MTPAGIVTLATFAAVLGAAGTLFRFVQWLLTGHPRALELARLGLFATALEFGIVCWWSP